MLFEFRLAVSRSASLRYDRLAVLHEAVDQQSVGVRLQALLPLHIFVLTRGARFRPKLVPRVSHLEARARLAVYPRVFEGLLNRTHGFGLHLQRIPRRVDDSGADFGLRSGGTEQLVVTVLVRPDVDPAIALEIIL